MGLVHHPNVVTDGLVCCWDAGNRRSYTGAGTTWTDPVGGQNGTFSGHTSFNSAKGGCLDFDGTDDYVSVPDSDYLDSITSAITVSVWVYWSSDANIISTIISKDSTGSWGSPYASWNMRLRHGTGSWGTDTVEFWAAGSYTTGGNFFSSSSIPRDTWTHIVGTYDGANQKIYINGVLDATDAQTAAIAATSYPLYIGVNSGSVSEDFEGSLANISIYNRALSADEVSQNYEALKPRFVPRITKSGLVGNWDAGDPESYNGGLTCKDTANGTAATLTNMEASDFNSANGGYWEFDGTDEYIQCSTDSVLQPQSFSVEAWVKDDQTEHYLPIVAWANASYPAVWTSYHSGTKRPIIYMNGPDYRYFDATAASVVGWHHVVFTYTYDDITTGAFYVDGVSITIYYTPNGTKASTDTCRIGRAGSYYYTGDMGLVRIYDTPLSAAEVMDNFQKTRGRFGV